MRVSDKVYILNQRSEPLMPCSPRKARLLLKQGKAVVKKRTPFTIQLTMATGEATQPITLGVDSGYSQIGLSAVTGKQEVFSAEVALRTDIIKLNSERKSYRRTRRSRNTWYRKPRFLNRKKPEGWLAPSIQHKLDSHIKFINQVKAILPITHTIIEVAAFDIQKIKNPGMSGSTTKTAPRKTSGTPVSTFYIATAIPAKTAKANPTTKFWKSITLFQGKPAETAPTIY